jgi:hypothetical protein
MKTENSQSTKVTAPIRQKPKEKPIEEEIEEEYNEEIDGDEELETPKPGNVPEIVRKPKAVPQETEEVSLADQIRNLHDEGIFRLELLGVLHQINTNLRVVAGVLADYKK